MKLASLHSVMILAALGAGSGTAAAQAAPIVCTPPPLAVFKSISEAEIQTLFTDVGKTKPSIIEFLKNDPEQRRVQLALFQELFAFASQSIKEGHASRSVDCAELEFIKSEVWAFSYDAEKNKNKTSMPSLGHISDAAVAAFWGKAPANRTPASVLKAREARFERFLETKLALLAEDNPDGTDRTANDEERDQARDFFAKIEIYADEYKRSKTLPKVLRDKIDLWMKLRQAQFLATRYSDIIAKKASVSEAEIDVYIRTRPEFDTAAKQARAEEILKRSLAGEDFANLANEFSEDPGNTDGSGEKHGGLYADVKAGQMLAAFEQAALSLEPGKVHPQLTATDYGYHVVKLEKKSSDGSTYDVRHILISTDYKDPYDPEAKGMPLRPYVRTKLEEEKTQKLTAEIVAANDISVPLDFNVAPPAKVVAKKPPGKRPVKRPVRKRN